MWHVYSVYVMLIFFILFIKKTRVRILSHPSLNKIRRFVSIPMSPNFQVTLRNSCYWCWGQQTQPCHDSQLITFLAFTLPCKFIDWYRLMHKSFPNLWGLFQIRLYVYLGNCTQLVLATKTLPLLGYNCVIPQHSL